jgi:hypothetical protein
MFKTEAGLLMTFANFNRLAFCFCLFSGVSAGQNRTGDIAGYVFKLHGSWTLGPQHDIELRLGYAVRNGESIRRRSTEPDDHIFIDLLDGSLLVRDCSQDAKGCNDLQVKSGTPPPGFTDRLNKLLRALHAPPMPPEVAVTRGTGDSELSEAVLPSRNSVVDPRPALINTRYGLWEAEFRPIETPGSTIRANLRWLRSEFKLNRQVPFGLYTLQLFYESEGTNTVVVLVSQDRSDAQMFKEAVSWIDRPGHPQMPPDVRQNFLRSVLYELSRKHSKSE